MDQLENVLVCVTRQKNCDRLIKYGADMIKDQAELFILHMVHKDEKYLHVSNEGDALEYLFDIAKKHGAELSLQKVDDFQSKLNDFICKNKVKKIILGKPNNGSTEIKNHIIAKNILNKELDIIII